MKDNRLHTPSGVRDFKAEFCAYKLDIQQRLAVLFKQYGFLPIESPMIEYLEVFEGMGSVDPRQMFTFPDRDGETLALRPDLTPPAVRIAATAFPEHDSPLRLSYVGNVFRNKESDHGKLREFTQAGIELMGVNTREADGEVLAVAIRSLMTAGLADFRIDISQVGFFQGLTEEMLEAGVSSETCEKLQEAVIQGDFVQVRRVAEDEKLPPGVRRILQELPALIGGTEMLRNVEGLVNSPTARAALTDLFDIYGYLEDCGLGEYLQFDLSVLGHLDYYTGFIFRGYTHGIGFSLLEGGRYDKLLSKFGRSCPAVGFSIKIYDLLSALQNQDLIPALQAVETLVAYAPIGRARALAASDELRRQGLFVENSLLGSSMETNMEYARKKKIGGLIYFEDAEQIRIVDLQTGEHRQVTYGELLNG